MAFARSPATTGSLRFTTLPTRIVQRDPKAELIPKFFISAKFSGSETWRTCRPRVFEFVASRNRTWYSRLFRRKKNPCVSDKVWITSCSTLSFWLLHLIPWNRNVSEPFYHQRPMLELSRDFPELRRAFHYISQLTKRRMSCVNFW